MTTTGVKEALEDLNKVLATTRWTVDPTRRSSAFAADPSALIQTMLDEDAVGVARSLRFKVRVIVPESRDLETPLDDVLAALAAADGYTSVEWSAKYRVKPLSNRAVECDMAEIVVVSGRRTV